MSKTTSQDSGFPGWYITLQTAVLNQLPRPGELDQVTAEGWQKNQKALKEALETALLKRLESPATVIKPSDSQIKAAEIMGKNVFGIAEAMKYYKVKPTKKELKELEVVPFSEEKLRAYAATHILVADFGLSVMDVWEQHGELFYCRMDPWYGNRCEAKWARKRVKAQWRLLRKTAVPDSFNKYLSEQEALLTKEEEVPEAREMVYMVIEHYLATDEMLFWSGYVRTKNLSGDGRRIRIGRFDSSGLGIDFWYGDANYYVGLASSVRASC